MGDKKNSNKSNRRKFLKNATLGMGAGMLGAATGNTGQSDADTSKEHIGRLPREVWIASVSHQHTNANGIMDAVSQFIGFMEEIAPLRPDIICLPETFPYRRSGVLGKPLAELAEEPLGPITRQFADFARKNHCYVICPLYIRDGDKFYNAAVLFDRQGNIAGQYRKIHLTEGELKRGLSPGPAVPPIFDTDFGRIGIQICFDINWLETWLQLKDSGAEIVFWPSAYSGGKTIGALAWLFKYCVVNSPGKNIARICDITGEVLATSNEYNRWACAPVNLEKTFAPAYPYLATKAAAIHARYGDKVRINKAFTEAELFVIESRSPEIKVEDILREFEIPSYDQFKSDAEAVMRQAKGS
jgi:hypothetical protein